MGMMLGIAGTMMATVGTIGSAITFGTYGKKAGFACMGIMAVVSLLCGFIAMLMN